MENCKPVCELIGKDGNVFNLVGIASKVLKKAGRSEQAQEMLERVFASDSYDAALSIIGEYVDVQ